MVWDNSVDLVEKYLEILDEKYKWEATTAILDADDQLVQDTQVAKTILLPKMEIDGLGDYSRNGGFEKGGVDVSWQSHTFTQDRGRQFNIDRFDNIETLEVAFGQAAEQFMRTQVVPEIDAYRFSTMAALADNIVDADLSASDVLDAIDEGQVVMDDDEVPMEGRVLYVSPSTFKKMKQSDALDRNLDTAGQDSVETRYYEYDGMTVIKVPKTRFVTEIDLLSGGDSEEAGGYEVADEALDINFMIVHPTAVLGLTKHANMRIFDPETNQLADGWLFDYRIYHDLFVPDNKTPGVYVHTEEDNA